MAARAEAYRAIMYYRDHAIDSLQQMAKEPGKTDAQSRGEFEMLLREMPRPRIGYASRGDSHWSLEDSG
jgi:hypothetical protein